MIIGAGYAGLIAAHVFPQHSVYEAGPRAESHKALLRFRTDKVAKLTGIEFDPVRVHKGIFQDGKFHEPSIKVANLYAKKVLGVIADRSIWNIDPVTRYIAPENFYEQLVDNLGQRIKFNSPVDLSSDELKHSGTELISTMPLPVAMKMVGLDAGELEFKRAPITVRRYRIPNCHVYQTVYFPTPNHSLYRASITGDMLICEFNDQKDSTAAWGLDVQNAFAIDLNECEDLGSVEQKYGKIAPIDESTRKALVGTLSEKHNLFSLGRFATWRNLLLDDIVDDAAVIKRLIRASRYERRLANI